MFKALGQVVAVHGHHPLIALTALRLDGDGHDALAQQIAHTAPLRAVSAVFQPDDAAQVFVMVALGHHHTDHSVALGLQADHAIELQGATQQRHRRQKFSEQFTDTLRVGVVVHHFPVARAKGDNFSSNVAFVEQEAVQQVVIEHGVL